MLRRLLARRGELHSVVGDCPVSLGRLPRPVQPASRSAARPAHSRAASGPPARQGARLPPPPPPAAAMDVRVFTFNISGDNTSAFAPPGFSLEDKYSRVVQLVQQHEPHLLALQARRRRCRRRACASAPLPPSIASPASGIDP